MIAVFSLLSLTAGTIVTVLGLRLAPEGFEDSHGFHKKTYSGSLVSKARPKRRELA